jgi:hypothetical protein
MKTQHLFCDERKSLPTDVIPAVTTANPQVGSLGDPGLTTNGVVQISPVLPHRHRFHHRRRRMIKLIRMLLMPKVREPNTDSIALEAERTARRRGLAERVDVALLTPRRSVMEKMMRPSGPGGAKPEQHQISDVQRELYGSH